jgi:serine protease inhibitor
MPLVFLAVAMIAVACGSARPTPPTELRSPEASRTPAQADPLSSAATATTPATSAPSTEPALGIGSAVVTVSDRLRVRSAPGVSDDSVKYEPLLPIGTELLVVGGPVEASGFVWWQVEPLSIALEESNVGWVAMADHDGEPWIALSGDANPQLAMAISDVARMPIGKGEAKAAAHSITSFGLDLYRRLLEDPNLGSRNVVFSPTSIALALGLVRAGARGETAAEIDDVLHVNGSDELLAGLNALDQALGARDVKWQDSDGGHRVALRIANASFAQKGWTVEQQFLDALASAFGAGLHLVDYKSDPEAARRAINGWVDQRTAGRIPELLAPSDVRTSTRLYLVNAIYFKAAWERWFDENRTKKASFERLDGSKVDVDMMARSAGGGDPVIPLASGPGWQAVDLRYKAPPGSPPLAMTLVLPKNLPAFESKLDSALLSRIVTKLDAERKAFEEPDCPPEFDAGCYPYDLHVYLPRFSIDTRAQLEDLLAAAGMPRAFDSTADFTGIHDPAADGEPVFISAVIHQANIDVDENGTEAAAATAIGMDTGGGPSALDDFTIRFNRPFLFFVRDVETGTILFMGRVVDPSDTP